jgi:outer membrane cobalamin receptor
MKYLFSRAYASIPGPGIVILCALGAAAAPALAVPQPGTPAKDAQAQERDGISTESGSEELATIPLEELLDIPVVTAASKFEQSISEAPSAVVVLTAQDIKDFGWRTLAEALASVPGLYVTNDRNYAYLGARGFHKPGDYNSRFLLMVDGVRTNDAVYDQASIGTEGLIDMELVSRIEYVPGPGSAVYGSNALFGTINVITKAGSSIHGAETAVAAGSYGEKKARATYGWHGQNGADFVLSAMSYRRNGQDLYFPQYDTADQNHGIANGLDYDRAQSLFVKASFGDFALSAGQIDRTKGVPTGSFGAVFDTPYSTRDTQSFIDAKFSRLLNPGLRLSATAYWGSAKYTGLGYYPDDDGAAVLNVDGTRSIWYGMDVNATVTAFSGHKIVAGMDMQRNARRDQYNYDVEPYVLQLDDRRSGNRTGAYLEDEIQLPAGFSLNAGLRYDWDSTTANSTNPRLALLYKISPRDTAKLIYGTAYRSPNAYELYYSYPGEGGQEANPKLKPEHISTRELVLEHLFSASGRATLSLFHYAVRDLIGEELDEDTQKLIFRNLDSANMNGAELALDHSFGYGYNVRASYSWQRATDADGLALTDSPRHLAKLNLATPLLRGAARLGTEVQCSSSRLTENARTGGFCLTNLTLASSQLLRHTEVSVSVYNAFNTRYADPAGPAFIQEALPAQSRTLLLKLVYGF